MIVCSAAEEPTPVADAIIPNLLLGNEAAAHSRELLRKRNVAAIVNVTPTENPHRRVLERKCVALLQIPVLDNETAELYVHFEAAIAFIRQQRDEARCVLVHCHQGTSDPPRCRGLSHPHLPLAAAAGLNFARPRPPDSPLTHRAATF